MPRGIYARRRSSTPQPRHTVQDTAPTPRPAADDAAEDTKLTAKVVRALDGIRDTFIAFVKDYTAILVRREDLAPKFMKASNMWIAETGGSFVDFVRVLDSTVPVDRDGYRAHRAYQAADYLRRLVQQGARTVETPVEKAARIASAPVNTRHAMARLLASFLPFIDPAALDAVWKAAETQLHWTEGQIDGMKELVKTEAPLVKVRAPRGVELDHQLKMVAAPVPAADKAAA